MIDVIDVLGDNVIKDLPYYELEKITEFKENIVNEIDGFNTGKDSVNIFFGRELIPKEFREILDRENLSLKSRYIISLLVLYLITNSGEVFNDDSLFGINRDLDYLNRR